MPSEQDARMRAVMDAITAPGGLVEITADEHGRAIAAKLPATLGDLFRFTASQYGDEIALVAGDERLSYRDLDIWSERLARALAGGHGIRKGDRVAIAMRNAPAWIVAFMAIAKAGGIATLVNGWWTADELAHGLALTTPVLVIADAPRARRVADAHAAARIVELPIERPLAEALAPLLDGVAEADLPHVSPDDDATILFTSGSTGNSKGAVSTHRASTTATYCFVAMTAMLLGTFYGGDRKNLPSPPSALIAVPLFHVTGAIAVFAASMVIARRLVLMPKWDAADALRLIEAEKISYFVGVPTMSLELMQHPNRDRFDLSSLLDIVAGGAPRPASHVPRLQAAFPAGNPMMGYGLTETNAVGCTNCRANYIAKPASTGPGQAPFVRIAIFDDDGSPVAAGGVGQVGIASAANIRGYWQNDAATAAAFTPDGYFLTGDLGYLDEDGYLFIVDRAKDIIIRGGENISCIEVESALYAYPDIAEASVFGLPDERLGEIVGAVVHPRGGVTIDPAALDAFLGQRLAKFKLPARLWFTDESLPRLGTGKIDKVSLRAAYRARAEAEAA
ncbi:class I adenylate-forming enzyme family protein [Sphingomonas sp. KC8]|uniref:class I adenylate-forming enzyme family protein n=1 Tax=Sphingomonas sp. KC8 TaxID=1030157 RepID=UPI00031CCB52|nr:class I adenylate-forming enzyme family protein [Sphingomonas sp. KC8]ARS27348.1 AMP-dependent ligase [Sphingomonas sp. KC8]